jgi:hypothetical protein
MANDEPEFAYERTPDAESTMRRPMKMSTPIPESKT